jgi:hypothetical protein
MRTRHLDAAETVFFTRQLEHIKARTYDIKYPELKARMFIPVSNEVPSGAKTVTYRQWDRVGRAKIVADGAKDLPRVDALAREFSRPTRICGDSFGYNAARRQESVRGSPCDRGAP